MELYAAGKEPRSKICAGFLLAVILTFFTLVNSAPAKFYHSVSDECDWFGSGLENPRSAGIQPLYLRCREGVVEWRYPRGALRIILRMGQTGKEFRGCLKVDSFSSGANLYLEEPQSLKPLYSAPAVNNIKNLNDQMCFRSTGGQVALYLEASGTHDAVRKEVFRLMYDLEPLKKRGHSECRPCDKRELLYLFCTSDFVARGYISSLYQNEKTQLTELTIHSPEILRDSVPKVFDHKVRTEKNETYHIGTLNRPLHCGTKVGSGEFLLVGRWRLGTPVLNCAPRWTEWLKIKQEAIESDNIDCVLE